MQWIGYYSGQRIFYEKDRFWLVERSSTYRSVGGIFLFIGTLPLVFAIYISAPTWLYILPLSLLIPAIMIFSLREGIVIDVETGSVVRWRKMLLYKKMRTKDLAGFSSVYLDSKVHNGKASYTIYEIWLAGDNDPLKIYTTSKKDTATSELDRIALLTNLPQIEPPKQEH